MHSTAWSTGAGTVPLSYEQTSVAPGDRCAHERNELGVDHALAGGVLARRLGLPDSLARTIENHHDEGSLGDAALIRVADSSPTTARVLR